MGPIMTKSCTSAGLCWEHPWGAMQGASQPGCTKAGAKAETRAPKAPRQAARPAPHRSATRALQRVADGCCPQL